MKWKIEKKYLCIGFIALGVIILAILFQYMLEHETRMQEVRADVKNTMMPIILGFVLAYLLNPILNFFEHYFFTPLGKKIWEKEEKEKVRKRFSRALGVFCTIILFLIILVGGFYLVVPQIYQSLSKIVSDAPSYYNSLEQWVSSLEPDKSEISKYILLGIDRLYSQIITYLNEDILPNMDKIVASITSGIVGGLKMLLNFILSIIISVYVMAEKETLICVCKKITFSLFNTKNANGIMRGMRYVNQVFGGFINGKIIDSFIIGGLCYLFMQIADLDYSVLISIIVGVTNIIPYFGPFIGAIPSVLLLLMVSIKEGLAFGIFVLVLQQVDGNIIGPLILGDRLKISSMWILFAILVGGGFFGVPGMILGAPCFACIYALVSSICKEKLEQKNLPLVTEVYYDIDQIEDGGILHMMEEISIAQESMTTERYVKEDAEEDITAAHKMMAADLENNSQKHEE